VALSRRDAGGTLDLGRLRRALTMGVNGTPDEASVRFLCTFAMLSARAREGGDGAEKMMGMVCL